jgi:nicotinate-nucleotide adenylyltransferase
MRLGILGGTFDPIHLGHLLMAEAARETLSLSRVLMVPAGDPPHKQTHYHSPAYHRRAMVEVAIADNPNLDLCVIDLERPGPHYSVDTVRLIQARYGLSAEQCYFIIGGDSLTDLPDWHNPAGLIELCRLAVIRRPGHELDLELLDWQISGLTDRLDWVDMPLIGIAGTGIRARVAGGQSIRYQVLEPVRDYIEQNGLYRQLPVGQKPGIR